MTSVQKFALVIPTLNEAGNIPALLSRTQIALARVDLDYELIIVDDDSRDETGKLVERHSQRDPRIHLLVRKGQRGLAGAVLHGWQHTDATLLGVMDADLQHPPEILPQLLEPVRGGVDIAIASRYATSNCLSNWNVLRQFISRCSTWATMPLQRRDLRISDPLSGFFIVRTPASTASRGPGPRASCSRRRSVPAHRSAARFRDRQNPAARAARRGRA